MTEKIIYQFNGETYETREEAEKAVYYYAEDTYDEVLDFTEWLINDYALYVDEWIEERENSINAFKEYLKEDNCYIYQKIIEEKELELRELKCIKYLIKNSCKLIEREDK